MLPKENRLKRSADFAKVYKKGRFFGTKLFSFRFLQNNRPETRAGFVVSTKIHKKATKRNLLKRRLREIIRLNLAKIKPGVDLVILTKTGATEKEYKELEKEIMWAMEKTGLIK